MLDRHDDSANREMFELRELVDIVIIILKLFPFVTVGVRLLAMIDGEGILTFPPHGFSAVLPGWSRLCFTNRSVAGLIDLAVLPV